MVRDYLSDVAARSLFTHDEEDQLGVVVEARVLLQRIRQKFEANNCRQPTRGEAGGIVHRRLAALYAYSFVVVEAILESVAGTDHLPNSSPSVISAKS